MVTFSLYQSVMKQNYFLRKSANSLGLLTQILVLIILGNQSMGQGNFTRVFMTMGLKVEVSKVADARHGLNFQEL